MPQPRARREGMKGSNETQVSWQDSEGLVEFGYGVPGFDTGFRVSKFGIETLVIGAKARRQIAFAEPVGLGDQRLGLTAQARTLVFHRII